MHRVFILSPAKASGRRADWLFSPRAGFELAQRLQRGEAQPIGEVFSFLSGLYFRGKLAYARRFGHAPEGHPQGWVITPDRGLLPMEHPITLDDLAAFRRVPIAEDEPRYRGPLERSARTLSQSCRAEFVLLGSISTGKYVTALLECLGQRLVFPRDFVGRGDMSRGGLLLRQVRDGRELEYQPIAGAVRRGKRPPKLEPWRGNPRRAGARRV